MPIKDIKIIKIVSFRNCGMVFAGGGDETVTGLVSPGSDLDLSEICLGVATLVLVTSDHSELHHRLERPIVDGEILQVQLTRSVRFDNKKLIFGIPQNGLD